ncbi:MAG: TIR domain-containing protein [Anaerolineaceae bacterium]|nr:TIR domain-containing protein [Anaerolineaceae bacterium]
MAGNKLFISYGHEDIKSVNWLERLKLYLAPLRRQNVVEIWDDSRIITGKEWRPEIIKALSEAVAAILLVGPDFLASEFILREELPFLLDSVKQKGLRLYPLVVGYCNYTGSELGSYQSFNDPNQPLEALPEAEQNRWLNEISRRVDEDLRLIHEMAVPPRNQETTAQAMRIINENLDNTWTAFKAQIRRRNELVEILRKRLGVKENLEYENFFFRYYSQLNDLETFQFQQIRAITEGALYKGNQQILNTLDKNPQIFTEIPRFLDLQQHLVFWLNKYETIFVKRPEMCLLYTGVEDGVPFPHNIGDEVKHWIKTH